MGTTIEQAKQANKLSSNSTSSHSQQRVCNGSEGIINQIPPPMFILPNENNIIESHKEQAIHYMAGSYCHGGRTASPRFSTSNGQRSYETAATRDQIYQRRNQGSPKKQKRVEKESPGSSGTN